jgi:large subunit ribosomal protein L21
MYAVVATGGKQLVVEKDTVAVVEKLNVPVGESVTLPALLVVDDGTVTVGADAEGATVTATVLEHFKGEKQIVFKFKKRKGYKRLKGHRQEQTSILVTGIALAAPKKAAKKAAAPAEPVEVVEAPAEVAAVETAPVEKKPAVKKPAAKKPAAKKPVKKAEEAAE